MASKKMKYENGKYYHVYNRGAHKQKIFLNSENYRFCLQLLHKYSSQYNISILAYCLMPNHYHLLVKQNGLESISKFIQSVFNSYSQSFNKVTGHSGTLFQGRFKGIEVDSEDYAIKLCRYIHCNPVEAKLVNKPYDWKHSDYHDWIKSENGIQEKIEYRNKYFGSAEGYEKFVSEYVISEIDNKYRLDT